MAQEDKTKTAPAQEEQKEQKECPCEKKGKGNVVKVTLITLGGLAVAGVSYLVGYKRGEKKASAPATEVDE